MLRTLIVAVAREGEFVVGLGASWAGLLGEHVVGVGFTAREERENEVYDNPWLLDFISSVKSWMDR